MIEPGVYDQDTAVDVHSTEVGTPPKSNSRKALQTSKERPVEHKLRLSHGLVATLLAASGIVTYWNGLRSPFQRDDLGQIVNSAAVHTLANIGQFFGSGTFAGTTRDSLTGIFYRPLMTVSFALIYAVSGLHTVSYHVYQLAFFVAAAFLVYLVLSYYMRRSLALGLALIFLVHPLNSMAVFYIAALQDVLFIFFGMLALWIVHKGQTYRHQWIATACSFAALLSKESAVIFMVVVPLYLFIFHRKKALPFALLQLPILMIYLFLRIHAVGLMQHDKSNPIDFVGLPGRLMTIPAILQFYLTKFVFPYKLALAYYWIYPKFSWTHVVIPAIIDSAVAGFIVFIGYQIRQKSTKANYNAFLFFALWFIVGLLPYLQIIALDMTVCETWFLASMIGLLGMIGIALSALYKPTRWLTVAALALLVILAGRTFMRGYDYGITDFTIDLVDATTSKENFIANTDLAKYYDGRGEYQLAIPYAEKAIDIFPQGTNAYIDLAAAYEGTAQFAHAAYTLQYVGSHFNPDQASEDSVVNDMSLLALFWGTPSQDRKYLAWATMHYSNLLQVWMDQAIYDQMVGDNADAKIDAARAKRLGPVPQSEYDGIVYNKPFEVTINNSQLGLLVGPVRSDSTK